MLSYALVLVGGMVLLVGGAHVLVQGASALALRLGLTPLVVGLTVVAFGTSPPELVVSVQAAREGAGGIAVGNVIGSNTANIGLILGLAVLVRPIMTDPALLRRDLPAVVAGTALALAFLADGRMGRVEGAVLAVALAVYVVWSLKAARRDVVGLPVSAPNGPAWRDAAWVLGGLAGLAVGADLFVGGAVALAEAADVSNAVIGLTVVAIGTSLPELATSMVAAIRGQGEIAGGNVVGSNLFNLLGVLGIGALARPLVAPGLQLTALAVMATFTVVLIPMLLTGRRLVRAEAGLLLTGYVAYIGYLAIHHG